MNAEEQQQAHKLLELQEKTQELGSLIAAEKNENLVATVDARSRELDDLRSRALGLMRSHGQIPDIIPDDTNRENVQPAAAGGPADIGNVDGTTLTSPLIVPGDIPAEAIAAIEREVYRLPPLSEPIDAWDLAAAVCAGLAGALLDMLVVRIPQQMTSLSGVQPGSPVTEAIRSALSMPTDNWLSRWAKVPFDRVSNIQGPRIPGMSGRQHRLLSLGHDPLLGLIFGLFDIHRGTLTGIDTNGHPFIRPVIESGFAAERWAMAPLVWLGHLLSDVGTKAGLPIPGFGLSLLLQFGQIGPNNRTIGDVARFMYLKGYDLRHYLSMGLSVGAVEFIVRGYSVLRYGWEAPAEGPKPGTRAEEIWAVQNLEAGFRRQRVESKQCRLLALAHSLAVGANVLKVHLHGGNPPSHQFSTVATLVVGPRFHGRLVDRKERIARVGADGSQSTPD